jgi:hypothetical protein
MLQVYMLSRNPPKLSTGTTDTTFHRQAFSGTDTRMSHLHELAVYPTTPMAEWWQWPVYNIWHGRRYKKRAGRVLQYREVTGRQENNIAMVDRKGVVGKGTASVHA